MENGVVEELGGLLKSGGAKRWKESIIMGVGACDCGH